MNKPKIVTIASLLLVVVVAISAFGTNSGPGLHPASARAHDLQIDPTPTPPYTPEAFIPVRMFALDQSGFLRERPCGEQGNERLYGCTAFCSDDDPIIDANSCNHEQILSYPYGTESVPKLGVENDYVPDVLSQEMGPSFENSALRAGAIAMRSFALQQREAVGIINNSIQPFQAFIPYKFNTYNAQYPGSTCGLPAPLINNEQQKLCNAVAPRYYLSPDYNDYPARANHIGDILGDTETAYNAEGNIDKPYLIGVADPISFNCGAANAGNRYGMSQSGANRWARGDQCWLAGNGSDPWSVKWATAEQILFHYFTRVQLRDADNDKKIISPDWRWNPLDIRWNNTPSYEPPSLQSGTVYTMAIQLQNTGINSWPCRVTVAEQMPIPPGFSRFYLRYRWARPNGQVVIGTGQVGACGLTPGQAKTVQLTLNDVPLWPADTYTLSLDIQDADRAFWFSTGGWPTYDIAIKIIAPSTPTPRPSPTVTVCPGC